MKKFIITCFLVVAFSANAQNFKCEQIDRYQLSYVYKQNINMFKISSATTDYTQGFIDKLSLGALKQICINSWGTYQNYGKDYMYQRFVDNNGYISKDYYFTNIGELEVLAYLKYQIKSKL